MIELGGFEAYPGARDCDAVQHCMLESILAVTSTVSDGDWEIMEYI